MFEDTFLIGVTQHKSIGSILGTTGDIEGVLLVGCIPCCLTVEIGSGTGFGNKIGVVTIFSSDFIVIQIYVCAGISIHCSCRIDIIRNYW